MTCLLTSLFPSAPIICPRVVLLSLLWRCIEFTHYLDLRLQCVSRRYRECLAKVFFILRPGRLSNVHATQLVCYKCTDFRISLYLATSVQMARLPMPIVSFVVLLAFLCPSRGKCLDDFTEFLVNLPCGGYSL